MADYALSNQADRDLTEIYIFSYRQFGPPQADAYLLALEETFCPWPKTLTLEDRSIPFVKDNSDTSTSATPYFTK